jgi:uncharacterized protein YkwD
VRTPRRRSPLLAAAIAAAALVTLLVPAVSETAGGDCTPGGDWPAVRADLASAVLVAVNQHRAMVAAPALVTSPTLTAAAVWKARHMARYGYMAHDDPAPPVARTPADRLAACGYVGGWGENIAFGYTTAPAVLAAWLASPGHKANLEQPAWLATGIGVAVAPNGVTYWAQEFGTTIDDGLPPVPPIETTPTTTTTTTTTTPPAPTQPPPQLRVGSPSAGTPHASRRFALRFRVDGASAEPTVRCSVRVGARAVRASGAFAKGYATCALVVPRGSRGRHLSGTVAVAAATQTAFRAFSRVVR